MCTKIVKYRWDWRKPRFPQDINKNSLNARVTQQRSQNRLKWFLDFKSVLWNISTAKSAPTHQKPSWVFRYFEFSHHTTSAGHNCPGCRQGLVSSHLWEVLSPKPAGWMLHGSSSRRRQTFARHVWWGKTLDLMCLYAQSGQSTLQLWPPVSSMEEMTKSLEINKNPVLRLSAQRGQVVQVTLWSCTGNTNHTDEQDFHIFSFKSGYMTRFGFY